MNMFIYVGERRPYSECIYIYINNKYTYIYPYVYTHIHFLIPTGERKGPVRGLSASGCPFRRPS
jgi:hypothetical protein